MPGSAELSRASRDGVPRLTFHKFALDVDQPVLDARIEARTDAMLAAGFLDEAERMERVPWRPTRSGIPRRSPFSRDFPPPPSFANI